MGVAGLDLDALGLHADVGGFGVVIDRQTGAAVGAAGGGGVGCGHGRYGRRGDDGIALGVNEVDLGAGGFDVLLSVPELRLDAPVVELLRDMLEDQRLGAETGDLDAGEVIGGVGSLDGVRGIGADEAPDDLGVILGARDELDVSVVAELDELTGGVLGDDDLLGGRGRRGRGRLGRRGHGTGERHGHGGLGGLDIVDGGIAALGPGLAGQIDAGGVPVQLQAVGQAAGDEAAAFDFKGAGIDEHRADILPHDQVADIVGRGRKPGEGRREADDQNQDKHPFPSLFFHVIALRMLEYYVHNCRFGHVMLIITQPFAACKPISRRNDRKRASFFGGGRNGPRHFPLLPSFPAPRSERSARISSFVSSRTATGRISRTQNWQIALP